MDFNEGVWGGVKYLWEIAAASLSVALSYILYRHKKQIERLDGMTNRLHKLEKTQAVADTMMSTVKEDIEEIKHDLKKILEKLYKL